MASPAAPGAEHAVQATAYLAAACRAAELDRTAPRVRDEWAARFVAARPPELPDYRALVAAGGDEVVTRTALLDALLGRALAAVDHLGTAPVLVNLGAGFCTRPYRLDLSACPLVLELDAAPVLERKAAVLAGAEPSCPVERVGLDLRDRARLAATLAPHGTGTREVVVLCEGLLPYLPRAEVAGLAATLASVLRRATWLTDLVSTASAHGMAQLARTAGAPLRLYGLDSLAPFEDSGWTTTDYRILPVARRAPPGAGPRHPGSGMPGSHQVVDGVLALRYEATGQPVAPGRTNPDS